MNINTFLKSLQIFPLRRFPPPFPLQKKTKKNENYIKKPNYYWAQRTRPETMNDGRGIETRGCKMLICVLFRWHFSIFITPFFHYFVRQQRRQKPILSPSIKRTGESIFRYALMRPQQQKHQHRRFYCTVNRAVCLHLLMHSSTRQTVPFVFIYLFFFSPEICILFNGPTGCTSTSLLIVLKN